MRPLAPEHADATLIWMGASSGPVTWNRVSLPTTLLAIVMCWSV